MKAEIIAVGTEILLGQIVNTNATYLSQKLTELGFDLYHQQVVGDNEARLLNSIEDASNRSDLVVLCGGLGPTEDDLTKQTVAKFVGEELMYDEEALKHVTDYFIYSDRPMTENNKQQALTIKGATTIQNPAGLACGLIIEKSKTYYLLLPGPPREMKKMVEVGVLPLLSKMLPNKTKLVSRYLRFMGIGESRLVTELSEMIETQTNPTIAPYAKSNEVMLRITAKCENERAGEALLNQIEIEIMKKVGDYFYGYGENLTMEEVVVALLNEKKQTLSIIETTTGGLCQSRISKVVASSEILCGGRVLYSDSSLSTYLNEKTTLYTTENGEALAVKIKSEMQTDYGLSIMIVDEKHKHNEQPVGTIFIAIATEKEVYSEKMVINRDFEYIKDGAVKHSLNYLRKVIKK